MKNKFLISLFILVLLNLTFIYSENTTNNDEKTEQITKINNYTYNIFMGLIVVFAVGSALTAFLILEHYGFNHLKNVVILIVVFLLVLYINMKF